MASAQWMEVSGTAAISLFGTLLPAVGSSFTYQGKYWRAEEATYLQDYDKTRVLVSPLSATAYQDMSCVSVNTPSEPKAKKGWFTLHGSYGHQKTFKKGSKVQLGDATYIVEESHYDPFKDQTKLKAKKVKYGFDPMVPTPLMSDGWDALASKSEVVGMQDASVKVFGQKQSGYSNMFMYQTPWDGDYIVYDVPGHAKVTFQDESSLYAPAKPAPKLPKEARNVHTLDLVWKLQSHLEDHLRGALDRDTVWGYGLETDAKMVAEYILAHF